MKLFGFLTVLVMGCAAAAAAEFKINGDFKSLGKELPAGWIQNKGKWAEPLGTVKVVKVTEKDGDAENAAQIVSTTQRTEVYTATSHPVKAGDVLEFEVKAKGTGQLSFGLYVYDEKDVWIMNQSEKRDVTADFQEYKVTLTVKDSPKAKAGKARFFFGAAPNSDITVKEIEVELKD